MISSIFKQRERHKATDAGGVDIFPMRDIHDLTGRDGSLVLLEYSEEHPLLLSQTGMASRIRNYYKRVYSYFICSFIVSLNIIHNLRKLQKSQSLSLNLGRPFTLMYRLSLEILLLGNHYKLLKIICIELLFIVIIHRILILSLYAHD